MGLKIRTLVVAGCIAVPLGLSGAQVGAATQNFTLDIRNGLIVVDAPEPSGAWTATVTGNFEVESNLPGSNLGLTQPQQNWLLTGSLTGTPTVGGQAQAPIDITESKLFSDEVGAITPSSAEGVIMQTLGGVTSPSFLYLLFGVQANLLNMALDDAQSQAPTLPPDTAPFTGTLPLGSTYFASGDQFAYSFQVEAFAKKGFSGSLEYTLSGLDFGASSSALAASDWLSLEFDSMEFELRTSLAPIPLPAALPLLAGGIGLLGLMGWRRRRHIGA